MLYNNASFNRVSCQSMSICHSVLKTSRGDLKNCCPIVEAEFDCLLNRSPEDIFFFFNVVPITLTDEETSQSKHMSIWLKDPCCCSTKQPQLPLLPPVSRCIVGRQINKLRRRRSPAFSLHNRDLCFSRPAEAPELNHPQCESAH